MDRQTATDLALLQNCAIMAERSSLDPSTKTGAIITSPEGWPIAHGYNRFPKGMAQTTERMANRADKLSRIVHCEIIALISAGGKLQPGCTLYTTPFMSCDRCVVIMLEAGIKRFVTYIPSAEKLARWGTSFELTRSYIAECGGELVEYENTDSNGGATTQREEHYRSQADGHFQSADSEERRYKVGDAWAAVSSPSRAICPSDGTDDDTQPVSKWAPIHRC